MSNVGDLLATIAIVVGYVGLVLVFLCWGASVLYRALDGDRFLRKGRVEARWLNSVSKRLAALGLISILLGLALVATPIIHFRPNGRPIGLVWAWAVSILFSLSPIAFAWVAAGKRAAGKPRCPTCLYSVAGLNSDTCPECGFIASSDALWYKPHRRKRGLLIASIIPIAALAIGLAPFSSMLRWQAAIPTSLLISRFPSLPAHLQQELLDRAANGSISASQYESLGRIFETQIINASSPDSMIAAFDASIWARLAFDIRFSDPAAFEAWTRSNLLQPATTPFTWADSRWADRLKLKIPHLPADARSSLALDLLRFETATPDGATHIRSNLIARLVADLDDIDETLIDTLLPLFRNESLASFTPGAVPPHHLLAVELASHRPNSLPAALWQRWFDTKDPQDRAALSSAISQIIGAEYDRGWGWVGAKPLIDPRLALPLSDQQKAAAIERLAWDLATHHAELPRKPTDVGIQTRRLVSLLISDEYLRSHVQHVLQTVAPETTDLVLLDIRNKTGGVRLQSRELIALASHPSPDTRRIAASLLIIVLDPWGAPQNIPLGRSFLALERTPELEEVIDYILEQPWYSDSNDGN